KVSNAALRFRPPETASAKSKTNNAPARATNNIDTRAPSGGGFPTASGSGGPGGGAGAGSRVGRRQRFQNMSPEVRAAMRARFGGGPGGGTRPPQEASPIRTVYIMEPPRENSKAPTLKPVTIRVGITDGKDSQVLEGLKEG